MGLSHKLHSGYLRVFDYSKEQLICGGKSYYGALLCCAWRLDMFGLSQLIILLSVLIHYLFPYYFIL